MKFKFILAIAICTSFLAAGCKKKTKEEFAGIDGDFVTGTPLGERIENTNFFASNVDRSQFQPIYFAFDSFVIEPSESSKINQVASALRSVSNTLIIAGFTDERGTEEYNRGLGEKRALAVREALISAGLSPSRIQTVSFGEEMPADPASNETAWALNRRAEFGVVK